MKTPTDYLLQATRRPAAGLDPPTAHVSWSAAEAAVAQALADAAEYRRLLLRAVRAAHTSPATPAPGPAADG